MADAGSPPERLSGVGLLLVYLGNSDDEQEEAIRLILKAGDRRPAISTIVLSEGDDPELRLRLFRLDARVVDCLSRPLNLSRLAFLADIVLVRSRFERSEVALGPACEGDDAAANGCRVDGFLFASTQMRQVLKDAHCIASMDTTVLITGETGTGKTHFARVIHELSPRKAKPFLTVHCGALSPALLESELFGHVRGAFTGAMVDRTGELAEVQDGTLLLDEIDCIPLESQAKLLRAVEERVFEPVGSNRSLSFRARLIVASNCSLCDEVAAGRFRRDLYYRFNVVSFCLPPLREQPELIRPLVARFLADVCLRNQRSIVGVSTAAVEAMEAFDWPGNVRELRNVVERAVALCGRPLIDLDDLPMPIQQGYRTAGQTMRCASSAARNRLDWASKEAELNHLVEALRRHGNSRSEAAADLGISRMTLYRKLRRFGLT